MIVFKPRLALFYFVALVIISVVTKRLTITSQVAMAEAALENASNIAQQGVVNQNSSAQKKTTYSANTCSVETK